MEDYKNKVLIRKVIDEMGWDNFLKELEIITFNRYKNGGETENMFYCLFLDIHNARDGYNRRVIELNKKAGFK